MKTDCGRSAWRRRIRAATQQRWAAVRRTAEAGMATAEYAIATLAAVAFATLLLTILRSDEVRGLLLDLVRQALSIGG
ncbi:DUF4244 domain-containing protein [Ruania albidiflava]|uniref:DUF4244 domain-containing protein n=1 Tax=Ruania albidiflava TaxID=366586 RepID=UPI0003B3F57C|nr:DUF4244 domain-containing protein [Ruania albidiflava]